MFPAKMPLTHERSQLEFALVGLSNIHCNAHALLASRVRQALTACPIVLQFS